MEPDIASTVTIERRFFETLVRRGELQPSDVPVSRSLPNDALIVSRADHEVLQRTARRYANLRQNLLRGGVVEDTINVWLVPRSPFCFGILRLGSLGQMLIDVNGFSGDKERS